MDRKTHTYCPQSQVRGNGNLFLVVEEPTSFLKTLDDVLIVEKGINRDDVEALIKARDEARAAKDWAKSDEARDKLLAMGIEIMDSPEGTTWEVKK